MNKREAAAKTGRREQRRTERQRSALFWNVVVLGTTAFAVLLVIAYIIANLRPGPLPNEIALTPEGRGEVPVGTELTFLQYPPASGTHFDQPVAWGFASEPVAEGHYLNNLARGGVVILYECPADCAPLEKQLQGFLQKAPKDTQYNEVKVIISRYTRPLPAPIVALAWEHQLNLSTYDEASLLTWYQRFVNYGPDNKP